MLNNNEPFDVAVPDPRNTHNYMLDTAAFNRLADNFEDIELFIHSKLLGYMYYITANQIYELSGWGANVYDNDCVPTYYKDSDTLKKKQPLFNEIMEKLTIQRVSSVGSLMTNHSILDGTYREMDDKSLEGQLMFKILDLHEKKRKKRPFSQHYDAMIAEAAIYNNCILVTNDSELMKIINDAFPSRAIDYNELVRRITHSQFLNLTDIR